MGKKSKVTRDETAEQAEQATPDAVEGEDAEAAAPEDSGAEDLAALRLQHDQAQAERDELKDKFVRLNAEMDNLRKRSHDEVDRARKYAVDRMARELLDVLESMDKACDIEASDDGSQSLDAMREGMDLTRKQLVSVLERASITEIPLQPGDRFDPKCHEAMALQPSAQHEPNQVVEIIRKGYWIHDRLLREAAVIVAAGPREDGRDDETGETAREESENA